MSDLVKYFFNYQVAISSLPMFYHGLAVTIKIAVFAFMGGISGGLLVAVVRAYQIPVVDQCLVAFIDCFRAIPTLVVVVVVYFGLPYLGISLSGEVATMLSLAIVLSAYSAEIFWSGVKTISLGQWEAGFSTGLRFTEVLVFVVIPRAFRLGIPMLTNRTIGIIKGTAFGSVVAAEEILSVSLSLQQNYANMTPLVVGTVFYIALFLPLVIYSRWLERAYKIRH